MVGPRLITDLHASGDAAEAVVRAAYFGAVPGGYAEGDRHLGVRVPVVRGLVRQIWKQATPADLDLLVTSEFHDARLAAVLVAVAQFKRADEVRAGALVDWTVAAVEDGHLDNWDLVDSVAPHLVGEWVLAAPERRERLDALSTSANPWSRRLALVATQALIRAGEFGPTLDLAAAGVGDQSRWVHKAAGWMLREVGQRDRPTLDGFLDQYAATAPREMLRAALARHDPESRSWYLAARSRTAAP